MGLGVEWGDLRESKSQENLDVQSRTGEETQLPVGGLPPPLPRK